MKKTVLLLLLIIVVALSFRIPALTFSKSFWFDEIVSLKIAQQDILNSWQYLKWENNPPLHYWFLHYWIQLFGSTEIALRFSSILFSLFGLIAIYLLGKHLKSSTAGLFAAFLLASSSYQIYLSTDARMYPMLLFFGILSSYYFWQLLYKSTKFNWFLYISFSLLTLYIHLTGFFFILSHSLYFIYHYFYLKKEKPKLSSWILGQIAILLLFAPWLLVFIHRSLSTLNSQAWYFNTQGGGFFLFQLPKAFLLLGSNLPFLDLLGLIIFGLLFVYSFIRFVKYVSFKNEATLNFQITPQFIFALTLFIVPLSIGFILQLWVAKYYLAASVGLYLILALGFDNLKIKKNYKILLVVFVLFLLLPYSLNMIRFNGHAWREVSSYIEEIERPGDKILISAFVYELPFRQYYQGNLDIIGYGPQGLEDDLLLKTVKYNWYPILNKDNMPDINSLVEGNNRVIIINPSMVESIHNSNLVIEWFSENNWMLINKKQFGGFIRPTVLIFSNPVQLGSQI